MTVRPLDYPSPQRSPYIQFSRREWAARGAAVPQPLSENEIQQLCGLNDRISREEVSAVYLPLSRLLNLYISATQNLHQVTDRFLGHATARVPYIIGIAGSVAVGKSTTARLLQALLARWPQHPRVDLVTTDGFLYPNHVLEKHGLMHKKGFPESYDVRRLIRFLADLKSGHPVVHAPVYSHLHYDIVPGRRQTVQRPDVLIVEGLNMLQRSDIAAEQSLRTFVSDFFDFSIYVDASEEHLRCWYIDRFLRLRDTAFRDPASYFRRYADLSEAEAIAIAEEIWATINAVNLHQNILPTRERAWLILQKGADHRVQQVDLRKL